MRPPGCSRCLHAIVCFAGAALASPTLRAQSSDSTHSPLVFMAGVTMQAPKDVNGKPQCTDLGLPCETPRTMPDFGLTVEAAWIALDNLLLVADGSIYGNSWVDNTGTNQMNRVRAVLGGFRLRTDRLQPWHDGQRMRAFAQLLAGSEVSTVVPTRTAVQPGIGIEVETSHPQLRVRAQLDYRWTQGGPRNLSTDRFLLGAVLVP